MKKISGEKGKVATKLNKKLLDTKELKLVLSIASLIWSGVVPYINIAVQAISLGITKTVSKDIDYYDDICNEINKCTKDALKLMGKENRFYKKMFSTDTSDAIQELFTEYIDKTEPDNINELEDKINNLLTEAQTKKIEQLFVTAFENCLYRYTKLRTAIIHAQVRNLNSLAANFGAFIGNEFLHKLYSFSSMDGMIKHLYTLFIDFFLTTKIPDNMLKALSHLQDEYNNAFKRYNQNNRTERIVESDLARYLGSSEILEISSQIQDKYPLLKNYIDFVSADCLYFQGLHDEAVEGYKKLRESFKIMQEETVDNVYEEIDVYLLNSIGWTYCLRRKYKDALVYLQEMNEQIDTHNNLFSCVYMRNYGVCLENREEYDKAIEIYEKIISEKNKTSREFKVYINYCSATMKCWDKLTEKKKGDWVNNVKSRSVWDLKFKIDIFKLMHLYLDIAEKINAMFEGIYTQKLKLLTYEMIIANNDDDRQEKETEAEKVLMTLDVIDPEESQSLYVKRDYNYALFMLKDKKIKELYSEAVRCNDKLLGFNRDDDSKEFAKVLADISID